MPTSLLPKEEEDATGLVSPMLPTRITPLAPAAQPAAQPVNGLINMYGDNPSAPSNQHALEASTLTGMPSGTNSQQIAELLARMSPDRLNAAKYKYELRNMTPLQRRAELERVAMDRALGVGGQGRVSVLNPTGPTLDDGADAVGAATQQDYAATSPEIQRLQSKARQSFLRELSDGLSTVDKSRFATIGDYDRWIQSLPSVQQSGGLIEGTIFNASRRFLTPNMRAQFEANDQNAKSFMEWGQNQTNRDFNGDGAPDTFAEVWAAANEGDSAASQILDMWRGDPNAKKYEVGPNNQVMQARPSPREMMKLDESAILQKADLQRKAVNAQIQASGGKVEAGVSPEGQTIAVPTKDEQVRQIRMKRDIERQMKIEEFYQMPAEFQRTHRLNQQTGEAEPIKKNLNAYGNENWGNLPDTIQNDNMEKMGELLQKAMPDSYPDDKELPTEAQLSVRYGAGTPPEEAFQKWLVDWRKKNRIEYFRMKARTGFSGFEDEKGLAAPQGAKAPAAEGATAATPQPTPTPTTVNQNTRGNYNYATEEKKYYREYVDRALADEGIGKYEKSGEANERLNTLWNKYNGSGTDRTSPSLHIMSVLSQLERKVGESKSQYENRVNKTLEEQLNLLDSGSLNGVTAVFDEREFNDLPSGTRFSFRGKIGTKK